MIACSGTVYISFYGEVTYNFLLFDNYCSFYRYYVGSNIFPDVLLNDIAGPEGDPLLLSLKLAVDVLVRHDEPFYISAFLMNLNCFSVSLLSLSRKVILYSVSSC